MKLILKNPLTKITITQYFGDNLACMTPNGKTVISKENYQKCPTGFVSVYGSMKGHNGLDIRAYHGEPVYASAEGFVEEVETEEARGLGLGIITEKKYDCIETGKESHFKLRYWHLQGFIVKKGDHVKVGDVIGWADNTGYSSGDHLHLELKPVEQKKGKWINTLQDNGFNGAVNPKPYFEQKEISPEEKEKNFTLFKYFYKLFTGKTWK